MAKFGHRRGRFTKANASRLGKLGVAAKARRRVDGTRDPSPRRVPEGEFLGCLTWLDCSGSAHRWRVHQGPRANNLRVSAKGKVIVCGWDHLLCSLRKHLAVPKKIWQ